MSDAPMLAKFPDRCDWCKGHVIIGEAIVLGTDAGKRSLFHYVCFAQVQQAEAYRRES